MKLIRSIGCCLLAVLAISALAASGAGAVTTPEFGRCLKQTGGKFSNSGCTLLAKEVKTQKFEWTKTILNNKFEAKQKEATLATLETVGGTKITCKSESNTGAEYSGPQSVAKIVADFTGCETGGIPCQSGVTSGEIITHSLKGTLGVEKLGLEGKESKNKLETQLTAETGSALANFSCSTINIEVIGCVAHPVAGGKMVKSTTEKFTASKGEQKPDKFLGGPVDECHLESNSGAGFEESGQTFTGILKNLEPLGIEANPKPEGE